MTEVMKAPYLKTSLPSPKTSHIMASKLTLPRIPRIGLIRLSVSEVTSVENAPPMMTPMAISIMLPFRAKDLNSSQNFFIKKPLFPKTEARCYPAPQQIYRNTAAVRRARVLPYFFSSLATVWAALSR